VEARKHQEAVKEREREMKEEREAERQVSSSLLSAFSTTITLYTLHFAFIHSYKRTIANPISQAHIQRIKDRRAAKEEKARYEKMAEKMHQKRVERLKRREKRNKLLNS
jgi:rRNA-processing protein CGR1